MSYFSSGMGVMVPKVVYASLTTILEGVSYDLAQQKLHLFCSIVFLLELFGGFVFL